MGVIRRWAVAAVAVTTMGLLAACGSSSSSSSSSGGGGSGSSSSASSGSSASKSPITIGTSLSLSGDFAADGQAFQRGYQLWATDQNAKGGLLGHKINLQVLSDSSSAVAGGQQLPEADRL